MSNEVTLINPFKVPAGKLEQAIKYWESHRDFMQTQPGYISRKLHQALDQQHFSGEPTFKLINIAKWESAEAFMNAARAMRSELGNTSASEVEGLVGDPALYSVIRE